MNLKIASVVFALILPLANNANANKFCSSLGSKLNQNHAGSIVQNIVYNYTIAGVNNYTQVVEYKYFSESIENQSDINYSSDDDYKYVDSEETFNNYFNNQNSQNITLLKLNDCRSNNYEATFSLKRKYPALTLNYYNQNQLPEFDIKFTKNGNQWTVSSINSRNCVDLLHTSLANKFREEYRNMNRITPESFYTINLKNMVQNEICPAHINKLKSHFNNIINGI